MKLTQNGKNVVVEMSVSNFKAILSSLNEIVGGIRISDSEFETRVGYPKSEVREVLEELLELHSRHKEQN